jgi:major membrane immunogen (membrane-anchored lipoprotein)
VTSNTKASQLVGFLDYPGMLKVPGMKTFFILKEGFFVRKIKKALALSLALAMGLSLVACGSKETTDDTSSNDTTAPTEESSDATGGDSSEETPAVATDEGSVLNIYCWNEEFKSRLTDHYAGYEEIDATTGKIGDVTVQWNITPSDDNAYQNNLDETLLAQDSAADDDKIDIFLVEADYALKYVDTDYTMSVSDLGITDAELADQYQYTKDVMTDSNGVLKGVSWQACPGVLIYNRSIANELWGTDDPDEVQSHVSTWDDFYALGDELAEKGYKLTATVNDTYRVYSNNVTSKWVEDGKLNIDPQLQAWAEAAKEQYDAGHTTAGELWGDEWSAGFYPEGGVFAYFGPAWMIDFSMAADDEASIAYAGGWGAAKGPQGFFWGGTWICAATGTDNPSLVADIMRELTTDTDVMTEIVKADNDFVNNKTAMEAMAADTSYGDAVLGGQNALSMFCAGVETIDLSNLTSYDQGCNEEFQNAMGDYIKGNYATYDDAVAAFKTAVAEKYPSLVIE